MIKNYIKEAQRLQQSKGNTSGDALKKYQQAIELYDGSEDGEYDFLYANYQSMWINGHIGEAEKALYYAQKCMELLDRTIRSGAIMHFTEMGKFYEEVIRCATNIIAWCTYANTDDTAQLELALETVSLGCEYADKPVYFYVFDTKVRILLKLGRKEEAFRIVYDCLKKSPHFSDFADIKSDRQYRDWKANFTSGRLEYSDEEKIFLEKAARITSRLKSELSEREKFVNQFVEAIPEKEMVSVKDIKAKYEIPDGWYEDDDYLLLYKGDVCINGNLDSEWYDKQIEGMEWENTLYGIVIDGSLLVTGDITIDEPILSIEKDVICDYLYSGDGHTLIHGKAHIRYCVYGLYNDGSLDIRSLLNTPYLIASDHSMPRTSDEGEFIYIEGGSGKDIKDVRIGNKEGSGIGWNWYYYDDSEKLFTNKIENEDGFSVEEFYKIIKRGENPFHEIE